MCDCYKKKENKCQERISNVITESKQTYFKMKATKILEAIPENESALVHALDQNEMFDFYVSKERDIEILYEEIIKNRKEWFKKTCHLWNSIYCTYKPTIINVIYVENENILGISSMNDLI